MTDLYKHIMPDAAPPVGVDYSWLPNNPGQMHVKPGTLPYQKLLVKGMHGGGNKLEEFRLFTRDGLELIGRGFDTSPDDGTLYQLTDGNLPVSAWCPRYMNVGDWYERQPIVTRYRANGVRASAEPHTTWLKFAGYEADTFKDTKGRVIKNVARLEVYDGAKTGTKLETYWYAEGIGMVAWAGAINGAPATSHANYVWPAYSGPDVPVLTPAALPGALVFREMPSIVNPPVTGWKWYRPVCVPYVVQSPFGPRQTPEQNDGDKTETHTGTDYTCADWIAYAAQAGRVVIVGWDTSGYGNLIKIDHGDGHTSLYGHLDSFNVAVGDTVVAGQQIGIVGTTGRSTGRHLHFEARLNNVAYAPAPEMQPHPLDTAPTVPPVMAPPVAPPDSDGEVQPDTYAAVLAQVAKLQQSRAAIHAELLRIDEVLESLQAAIGFMP